MAFQDNLVCVNQLRYYDVLFRDLIAFKAQVLKVTQARIQINRVRMRNAGVNFDCFRLLYMGRILRNRAGCLERFLQNRRSVRLIAEAVVGVRQLDLDRYFLTLSGVRVLKFCRRDGVIRVGRQTVASDAAGRNGCVCRAVVGARLNGGRKGRVGQTNPLNGQLHGVRRKRIIFARNLAEILIGSNRFVHCQRRVDFAFNLGFRPVTCDRIPLVAQSLTGVVAGDRRYERHRFAVIDCPDGRCDSDGIKRRLLYRFRCICTCHIEALVGDRSLRLPVRLMLESAVRREQFAVVCVGRVRYVDGVVFAAVERELAVACDFQTVDRNICDLNVAAANHEGCCAVALQALRTT